VITVKEDTTLVGISELRTNMEKVLEAMAKYKVIIEKRNRPIAVMLPIAQYNRMEEMLEFVEDRALGYLAKIRDIESKPKDYISLGDAERKVSRK